MKNIKLPLHMDAPIIYFCLTIWELKYLKEKKTLHFLEYPSDLLSRANLCPFMWRHKNMKMKPVTYLKFKLISKLRENGSA